METKICCDCKNPKKIDNFSYRNKKKQTRQARCKECHKKYAEKHYTENKVLYKERASISKKKYINRNKKNIIKYLQQHPCQKCDNKDIDVLEFHHINSEEKEQNISRMVHNAFSWSSILNEISKCQVLCANCHRKLHKLIWSL